MIRREFGIYGENLNNGFNEGFDDTLRVDEFDYGVGGGGGGRITQGGGGSTIIRGCTDSKAKNYNRLATRDDGSCRYNPPPLPVLLDKSKSITFTIGVQNGK